MNIERQIGKTNHNINPIGLGAMPLSLDGRPNQEIAFQVINTFVEMGGNFIDTANVYCEDDTDVGHNERLISNILKKINCKKEIYVATKGGLRRPKGTWTVDASPEWLRESCEKSLVDLDTESIFLYQLHAPDPEVPFAYSVEELSRLKTEGKIQHVGLSNVDVEKIKLAISITDIVSVQNRCNLFERKDFKNGVIEFCEQNNITFIAHSPVGGHFNHKQATQNSILNEIADKHQATPYQIMLTWLLEQSNSIIVIPGASKVDSIKDSMKSHHIDLSDSDIGLLSETR